MMKYYSAIKKNEIMSFAATWIDLETVMLNDISQTDKKKYSLTLLICGTFKNYTDELIYKTETHRLREGTYEGNSVGGGIDREFGIDMYTLLYLKWITNKDLLYNTGNSTQYCVTT